MERPGFSFLISPDSALLKSGLDKLVSGHPPPGKNWKRAVFWGDEEPDGNFWNSLNQMGLFASHTLIIVRQAELWNAAVWKQLDAALARRLEHAWPLLCLEVQWEKGKPKIPACIQKSRCFALAEKKGWLCSWPPLSGAELQRFAQNQAKTLALRLSSSDLADLCSSVAPDANSITNELKKLSLLSPDERAGLLSSGGLFHENDAFRLIKKLMAGDLAGVWKELWANNDEGLLFFVLALLARELRLLWQLASGEEPRMHPSEAQRKRALAKKLGHAGLSQCFSLLAQTEWNVKSGRASPGQALESLCAQITAHITREQSCGPNLHGTCQ